jgi:hypothetical protein
MSQLTTIAQDAWAFLAGLLVIMALLGGLYFVLQGTAGVAFGGGRMTGVAILGAVGIVVLVLFAFLVIPELGGLLESVEPAPPF